MRVNASTCLILLALAIPATAEPTYTYNKRTVTKEWVDARFKEFAEHIVMIDGAPRLVWDIQLRGQLVPANPPAVGTLKHVHGKVYSVGEDHLIVDTHTPGNDTLYVRVTGINTAGLADEQGFAALAVYVGTTRQAGTVYQEYRVPPRITSDQFAKALADGFKLVRYSKDKIGKVVATPIP